MRLVPVILALSVTAGVSAVPDETLVDAGLTEASSSNSGSSSSSRIWSERSALEVQNHLFPDRTKGAGFDKHGRSLSFENAPYTKEVLCQTCDNLQTCQILNTLLIQEVYYPSGEPAQSGMGTCAIIEQRGIRMAQDIFGPDKTFRDTPTCQGIVMQYLCLFWGSDNSMYTNFCIYQEDVSDPNPLNHKISPRPPCRSFCTQVATLCANNPDQFYLQCSDILCPPTQDTCTPDPVLGMQSLSANLGCLLPFYLDPYSDKNSSSRLLNNNVLCSIFIAILSVFFVYM